MLEDLFDFQQEKPQTKIGSLGFDDVGVRKKTVVKQIQNTNDEKSKIQQMERLKLQSILGKVNNNQKGTQQNKVKKEQYSSQKGDETQITKTKHNQQNSIKTEDKKNMQLQQGVKTISNEVKIKVEKKQSQVSSMKELEYYSRILDGKLPIPDNSKSQIKMKPPITENERSSQQLQKVPAQSNIKKQADFKTQKLKVDSNNTQTQPKTVAQPIVQQKKIEQHKKPISDQSTHQKLDHKYSKDEKVKTKIVQQIARQENKPKAKIESKPVPPRPMVTISLPNSNKPKPKILKKRTPIDMDDAYDLDDPFIDNNENDFQDSGDLREFNETIGKIRKRLVNRVEEDEDIPEDSFEEIQRQERNSRYIGKKVDEKELKSIEKETQKENLILQKGQRK